MPATLQYLNSTSLNYLKYNKVNAQSDLKLSSVVSTCVVTIATNNSRLFCLFLSSKDSRRTVLFAIALRFAMRARTAQRTTGFPRFPMRATSTLAAIHLHIAMLAATAFNTIPLDFAMRTRFAYCTPGAGEFPMRATCACGAIRPELTMRTTAALNTGPFYFSMRTRLALSTPSLLNTMFAQPPPRPYHHTLLVTIRGSLRS